MAQSKTPETPREKSRGLDSLLGAIGNSNNQSALDVIDGHAKNALRGGAISDAEYKKIQEASAKRVASFKRV